MKSNIIQILVLFVVVSFSSCKKESEEPASTTQTPTPAPALNSLIANPQQGKPFTTGVIDDFILVANDKDVAIVVANNTTGKIYIVASDDNNVADASANAITSIPNLKNQIAQKMGVTSDKLSILDMEVNPISKSVYVLVEKQSPSRVSSLFKITKGNEISLVDLENVSYVAITFSTNNNVLQDMSFGGNDLYVSIGQIFGLAGEIGKITTPFTHDVVMTKKATTVFKSNWGGGYHTNAPLERMVFGKVDGKNRLIGVTTCAPGFSFEVSDIVNGAGLLQVEEYFNLNGGMPSKVSFVNQNDKVYLIELHENHRIVRIGKKYIDGTGISKNMTSPLLIQGDMRAGGLTDEDLKIYNGSYIMMAKYSDTQFLVIEEAGNLSLLTL